MAFKVAKDCSGGKQILPNGDRIGLNQQTTFRVKAGEDFSFSVHYLGANGYCHMPATFHPQAGRAYVAQFTANDLLCFLSVWVGTPTGTVKEPSFKLRKWRTPMWEDGSFCGD